MIEKYYQTLYDTKTTPPLRKEENDRIVLVRNIGSEDIPEITKEEVRNSINYMQNRRAPGEDGIIIEIIENL